MADKKISQLTSATTPLAGTEVLPIVQSSTTVQVSAANVTAGRAFSGASFDVTGSTAPANGMYLPAANSVALSTNSSVRFRVDASGNAGLGVTPAAHGSSERALDIGNTTSFGRQSDAALVANFNTFLNASSQYIYRISSFASSYQQLAGEHKFFTAPSGTAGNAVTLTQQMTITQPGDITANTGNFVVGTSAKGITNSTGSVLLAFSTVGTALTGGAQSVLTGSFNNIGTAQTITPADTNGGYIVITGIQPGIGSTTYTLPFVKRGGTAAIGTPSKAILTADPLLSVAASGGDIVVTPIAGNTYITYAIYYTPLGA